MSVGVRVTVSLSLHLSHLFILLLASELFVHSMIHFTNLLHGQGDLAFHPTNCSLPYRGLRVRVGVTSIGVRVRTAVFCTVD